LAKELLLKGADQFIAARKGAVCPIHEAIRLGKDNPIFLLIAQELFANNPRCLEVATAAGLTAMHYAAETLDMEMLHWVFVNTPDEHKQRLTNDGNTALHYAGACRFLNGFVALVREGFAYDVRNHSQHTAIDKLLNAWPRFRDAFVYVNDHANEVGPFIAMTMGFFGVSVDQAQELADDVTEQQEADWSDTALQVRDLVEVYALWSGQVAPGGAQP
jgi:ankyrin repeat protein